MRTFSETTRLLLHRLLESDEAEGMLYPLYMYIICSAVLINGQVNSIMYVFI